MSTRSAASVSAPGAPVSTRPPAPIELPREVCTLYPRASRLEWLLSNGTGGFAMGTVAGSNTRRYHGLLVASLHPPVQRVVTLARIEETALTAEGAVPLSVNQYPNTLYPDGYTRLQRFAFDDGPVWTWSVGGVEIERRVLLVPGQQTVVLRYASTGPVRLRVEPLLAFRDYHGLTHRNPDAWTGFEEQAAGRVAGGPLPAVPGPPLAPHRAPWGRLRRRAGVARERGVPRGAGSRARLPRGPAAPGQLRAGARAGAAPAGRGDGRVRAALDLDALVGLFLRAEPSLRPLAAPRPVRRADAPGEGRARLERAADAYLVRRADRSATVIAGYPWFTDWGRDTMISLPGLTHRPRAARARARGARGLPRPPRRGPGPQPLPRRGGPGRVQHRRRDALHVPGGARLGAGRWLARRSSATSSTRRPAPSWTRTSGAPTTASTSTRRTGSSSPAARARTSPGWTRG